MIPPGFSNSRRFDNVVLEGCDGAGKTSIAKALVRASSDFRKVVHVSNPSSLEEGRETFSELVAVLNASRGLVYDRAQVGERVYSPIKRGYYPEYMDALDRQVGRRTLFVLVTAPSEVLHERYDGEFITEDEIDEVAERFYAEFMRAPLKSKTVVDTSLVIPEQAAWWIMCLCGSKGRL